ncbi:MAG: M48 family metalloprotease [Nitrospirota bacterium]
MLGRLPWPRQLTRGIAAITVAAIVLWGCVTAPEHTSQAESSQPTPSKAYGRAFLAEARQTFRFILDPDVTGPVQATGARLVRSMGEDVEAVHFFVVDEPQPNAFVVPGGYVFVFSGLLAKLSDEEELAGVLAHELGHVSYNHFFQNRNQVLALNLATVAALLLSGGHPAALAFGLGADYHLKLAYSRDNENEADAAAVKFLRRAGYDPSGLARFFRTLEIYERFNPPLVPAYFTTHPGVSDRLRVVETMIAGTPPPPSAPRAEVIDWGRLKASLNAPPDEQAATPRDRYLRGVYFAKNHRVTPAITEFRAVLAADPRHGTARAELAWALLLDQHRDDARREARRAQQDAPESAGPYLVLGILAQDAGDHREAVRYFQDAVTRAPEDPTTHLRLASSYAALNDPARERYHLGRHLRLSLMPERAAALYQQLLTTPGADPELKRAAEHEIQIITREGI